jgi:hypothetical protein
MGVGKEQNGLPEVLLLRLVIFLFLVVMMAVCLLVKVKNN